MKLFDSVSMRRPKRNKFDLSHERKMSLEMGNLVPMLVQEVLPGDSFRVNSECMLRMSPLLAPVMHRVNVFMHYFFVPYRLVWDEWKDFITGGREGTSVPVVPYFENNLLGTQQAMQKGSLSDYLGIPVTAAAVPVNDVMRYSALTHRAYHLVYQEYFRDQNLEAENVNITRASGALSAGELTAILSIRKRAWEKDYFTSALPWAQRGGSVGAPITGSVGPGTFITGDWKKSSGPAAATGDMEIAIGGVTRSSGEAGVDIHGEIEGAGELSNASVTINELRRSVRLQEWLEKNARGGARYVEQILSHFGVRVPDSTIQRPLYLGGGRQPIVISEVLSTGTTPDGEGGITGYPQGNMSGHGFSAGYSNGFKQGFVEHGIMLGLMSVLPKTAYQQGVPKLFRRHDKLDHAFPEFANIGEQEILNSELYYAPSGTLGTKDGVFGYQSRYAEYKYQPSTVHGDFLDTLAFWHMGRIFASPPALNQAFVTSDPTERIFAVATGDSLYCQIFNRVSALRPLPYFGVPVL